MRKYIFYLLLILMLTLGLAPNVFAGLNDRDSNIDLTRGNYIRFDAISAPTGNPLNDDGWLYIKLSGTTSVLYFEDDTGTVHSLTPSATAWDDITDPDAIKTLTFSTYTTLFTGASTAADQWTFRGTGNFGDVSVVKIESLTGNPTDGTVLEVVSHDTNADALVVNANSTEIINVGGGGVLTLNGGAGVINFTEFDVSGTTGSVTIDDGGNVGNVSVEGTILDINSLDFVGAGEITSAASSAITLNPNAGNAAGETLIITAYNITLSTAGLMTFTPPAALPIALNLEAANIATALSVAANDIVGTTGLINYTNFDVDAAGAVVCTALNAGSGTIQTTGDITAGGTITGATIAQDAIVAASANTTITLDGTGNGGVSIGTTSGTGTITLGGGGFATEVNLPTLVDLVLAGGDLTITDTANATMVAFTNVTLTSQDLFTITAGGTRTSNEVFQIADSATTANTMSITTSTQTSGSGYMYTNSGAGILTGSAYYAAVTDGAGFTGYYFRAYDGAANDFSVKRYGATIIAGNATGTDALTITAGDLQITSGFIDVDAGYLSVDTALNTTSKFERAQATVTGPVLSVIEQTHTAASGRTALFIDQDTTTNTSSALEIDTEGAYAIKIDALIAAGDGILVDVADSYTGQWFIADAGPWLGTAGEGFWQFTSDIAATNEAGQVIRINLRGTGTAATATDGKALYAHSQTAIKAGESLVFLDTLTNIALHISNEGVAADSIKIDVANSYTGQGIVADLGPWLGTAGEGFINIQSDSGAVAEAGQAIRILLQGTSADAAAISGKGLYIKDAAAATVGSFLLHVESDVNGAAYLDGNIDINFTNLDDNLNIVSNAINYAAGDGILSVHDTSVGQTNTAYLLRLSTEAAADANNGFIHCEVGSTGAAGNGTDVFSLDYAGSVIMAGSLTVNGPQIIGDGATEVVGTRNDVVDGGAGTPITVTIAQSMTVFTNTQATEFDLPADPTGLEYTFVVTNASNFHVDPDGTDQILHSTCAAGDRILSATVGDTITLIGVSTSAWYVKSVYPAVTDWTDAD